MSPYSSQTCIRRVSLSTAWGRVKEEHWRGLSFLHLTFSFIGSLNLHAFSSRHPIDAGNAKMNRLRFPPDGNNKNSERLLRMFLKAGHVFIHFSRNIPSYHRDRYDY